METVFVLSIITSWIDDGKPEGSTEVFVYTRREDACLKFNRIVIEEVLIRLNDLGDGEDYRKALKKYKITNEDMKFFKYEYNDDYGGNLWSYNDNYDLHIFPADSFLFMISDSEHYVPRVQNYMIEECVINQSENSII